MAEAELSAHRETALQKARNAASSGDVWCKKNRKGTLIYYVIGTKGVKRHLHYTYNWHEERHNLHCSCWGWMHHENCWHRLAVELFRSSGRC